MTGLTGAQTANDEAQRLRDLALDGELLVDEGLADLFGDAPEPAILVGWSDLDERFRSMLASLETIAEALDAIRPPNDR